MRLESILFLLMLGCIDESKQNDDADDDALDSENPEASPLGGMTEAHNVIRRAHGIESDLKWDEDLVQVSTEWLQNLDTNNNCQMEHNWDSPLGENLMWAPYGWASEEEFYDYDSNSCVPGEMCGHYTQIVWEATERVGCAMIICNNEEEYMWMCNYDPAGNWVGEHPY